ncbi:MAG: Aldehyde dehydrogenase [uncultured Nocardioidaceae bacterium]|uniref:Aldehyde dehydrogenase n=1 Tax=uncultured Nocardioidaceae bacterium TaxID=253824 RepID=A0A6J4MFB3_9ACTN|nr:MAG: Aldehyde dehydrogenase [uncultured Nocardioidaceae bacterium]
MTHDTWSYRSVSVPSDRAAAATPEVPVAVPKQMSRLSRGIYVRGTLRESAGETWTVRDPATEEVLGEAADTTDDEVDDALVAAGEAWPGWWALSALERAERLHRVAHTLRGMRAELAELLTREMGKPYKEAADEVDWAITALDYYAEIGRHDTGRVVGPAVAGQMHYTVKEPMGVVAVVLPFNYPYVLLCWEAAAALAAGNAVVVKPSEYTSLSTLRFVEAFEELGPGVVQCVTGRGRVGARLVGSRGTHMVAFTGSVPTGRAVAHACAETFKPHLIETSGNDPFLVMPSAPLEVAARGAVFASFINCGQVCTSAERFYVHTDVYDDFARLVVEHARALRVGNGLDKVDVGPMVNDTERRRFTAIVDRAVEQGATVACGGRVPEGMETGWFYEPTVLLDVTPEMDIVHDEAFGPVAPLVRVESFEEALRLANDSEFGLGANLYSRDLLEVFTATNGLESGMVWVNAPLLDNDAGPFGGRKLSGTGRQLGAEGLDQFRHTKFVMVDPAAQPQDFWWFPYADEECHPGSGA